MIKIKNIKSASSSRVVFIMLVLVSNFVVKIQAEQRLAAQDYLDKAERDRAEYVKNYMGNISYLKSSNSKQNQQHYYGIRYSTSPSEPQNTSVAKPKSHAAMTIQDNIARSVAHIGTRPTIGVPNGVPRNPSLNVYNLPKNVPRPAE